MNKPHRKNKFPKKLFLVSFAIYALSLILPAYTIADYDGTKNTNGIATLFMGALSILGGGFLEWLIWLANPFFFISILFKRQQKETAVTFGWLASIIALSFSLWGQILAAENGRTAHIESKGFGYLLWVLSLFIWTFGISLNNDNQRRHKMTSTK